MRLRRGLERGADELIPLEVWPEYRGLTQEQLGGAPKVSRGGVGYRGWAATIWRKKASAFSFTLGSCH
jgi:hypothetical protein